MSTNINITVNTSSLLQAAQQQQAANRQGQLDREVSRRLEEEATTERIKALAAQGRDANGTPFYVVPFAPPSIDRRPAASRGGISYYWLASRAWWFDIGVFNNAPRPGASLSDIAKVTTVSIQGSSGISASYQTLNLGGDSVRNLLNGRDSSDDNFYTLPLLPAGTSPPSSPYISQMGGPRKTLPENSSGFAEYDSSNYTRIHDRQLPILGPGATALTFCKPFYNIYSETLESTEIAMATKSQKFKPKTGLTSVGLAVNHGVTFAPDNSTLFNVNHAYLVGKFETGTQTVKPLFTRNIIHVFIRAGEDRSGSYSVVSSGSSHFAVGDVVYWINYLMLEPTTYRYGTITSISRGTFSYQADPEDPSIQISVTGLRIALELSQDLTLDYSQFFQLFNSTIVKVFTSTEQALASSDTVWFDTLRQLGGVMNEWVTRTIEGEELGVPNLAASFVGDSGLSTERMDCSRGGYAYFIQSVFKLRDEPPWRRQENYFDGDIVAQRPGIVLGSTSQFRSRSVAVKFIQLKCSTNTITNTFSTEVNYPSSGDAYLAAVEVMPDWFPSKRYRMAGYYNPILNLNLNETVASRISNGYDPETSTQLTFIKSWPLDQSLPIEGIIEMLNAESNAKEVDVTKFLPQMDTEIEITETEGPARWGYTYTQQDLVSG